MRLLLLSLMLGATLLAQDNLPPEILTGLFHLVEWTLGTPLSSASKLSIQETQTLAWRKNEGQTRHTLRTLVQFYDQVRQMPPSEQAKLREQMKSALQQSLGPPPAEPAPTSPIPPELIGVWSSVHTSMVHYQNNVTGSFAPPSGTGTQYTFFPDGRYQSATLLQSSLYNCTMTINAFEEGVLEFQGAQVTFRSRGGTLDSKDNCSASSNYQKSLPPNEKRYRWRMERDAYGVKLCVVRPGVKEDCAYQRK